MNAGWSVLGDEPRRIHHYNGQVGARVLSVLRAMPRSSVILGHEKLSDHFKERNVMVSFQFLERCL